MSAMRMITPYNTTAPLRESTDVSGVRIMPVPLLEGDEIKKREKRAGRIISKPRGTFKREAMFKYQLANWYGVSMNHFTTVYLPPVMKQLIKKGYRPQLKLLTLAMVNIICDFEDDPE